MPFFTLTVTATATALTGVAFGDACNGSPERETELTHAAFDEIHEYLEGKRREFDLPLEMRGTPFQLKIWEALRTIPYGTTVSYREIARAAGNEQAARAAGGALNANPIAIIVPCHRVIGSDGSLTGFAGGIELKEKFIRLEECFDKKLQKIKK
jgi:methylated-DNA-[protein]-cysteine S-methyltransferase